MRHVLVQTHVHSVGDRVMFRDARYRGFSVGTVQAVDLDKETMSVKADNGGVVEGEMSLFRATDKTREARAILVRRDTPALLHDAPSMRM